MVSVNEGRDGPVEAEAWRRRIVPIRLAKTAQSLDDSRFGKQANATFVGVEREGNVID